MKIAVFQGINTNWFFVMVDEGRGYAPAPTKRFGAPKPAYQWVEDHYPNLEVTWRREHHTGPFTTLVRVFES